MVQIKIGQGPLGSSYEKVDMSNFIDLFQDSMCALSVMRRGRLLLEDGGGQRPAGELGRLLGTRRYRSAEQPRTAFSRIKRAIRRCPTTSPSLADAAP